MTVARSITPTQLFDFLLQVAPARSVFIWGPPGIGKSALVRQFAEAVGLPCISLLGSQLAPEDLVGVPQIVDGKSRFCPPDAPLPIITDGACDRLVVRREHAYLMPGGTSLPFPPRGPVFRIEGPAS